METADDLAPSRHLGMPGSPWALGRLGSWEKTSQECTIDNLQQRGGIPKDGWRAKGVEMAGSQELFLCEVGWGAVGRHSPGDGGQSSTGAALLGEAPAPARQLPPLTFQRGRKMQAKEMGNTSYTPI